MMPPHPDSLEDDLDDAGDELEFAAAFASGDSLRPAFQEAKDGAQASRTQFGAAHEPGRSLIPTHPIILRDLPVRTTERAVALGAKTFFSIILIPT